MKRRSTAATLEGKWRRPLKRAPKITDNFYSSSLVYVKLLVLWALVLTADYFLDFRFEYLWPFWLFLRSVYDSFKYQGLAFSVFFICIAVTSDMICYLFIPVHWLFFAASTYVWVQYVWHTEKGICLPTVALWLLFVYIETSIRLKEFKAHLDVKNFPFHLDLCRPFAAHCIGYPVVTLGFGFKSYIGYRFRIRRQKEIQKSNEYYFEFLREALPPGQARDDAFNPHPSPKTPPEDRLPDAVASSSVIAAGQGSNSSSQSGNCTLPVNGHHNSHGTTGANGDVCAGSSGSSGGMHSPGSARTKVSNGTLANGDADYIEKGRDDDAGDTPVNNASTTGGNERSGGKKGPKSGGGSGGSGGGSSGSGGTASTKKNRVDYSKLTKEEMLARMEQEIKKYKVELQLSRNKENELREQIISYMSSERTLKSEISTLQVEKSVLESRVSGLISTRAGEKATLSTLEKKLADERKQKAEFQIKLETERKTKKEAANAERTAQQNQTRSEVLKLEAEIKTLRSELATARERCHTAEEDLFVLRKYKETHGDPEMLLQALKAMQEKNSQIEKSLSEETKVKLDLFSALGETKRELSIKQNLLAKKDGEISELKAKIAEVLAVMPSGSGSGVNSSRSNNAAAVVTSNSVVSGGAGGALSSAFSTPNTLALDLPHSTDLSSYAGAKMSSLGLADLDGKLCLPDASSVYQAPNPARFSPKTNGNVD